MDTFIGPFVKVIWLLTKKSWAFQVKGLGSPQILDAPSNLQDGLLCSTEFIKGA